MEMKPLYFTQSIGMQRKLVVRKNEADIQRETMVRSGERASCVLYSTPWLQAIPEVQLYLCPLVV